METTSTNVSQKMQTSLVCAGCGAVIEGAQSLAFQCPNAESSPEIDHLVTPLRASAGAIPLSGDPNPFVRYRAFLYPYRLAREHGVSDERWIEICAGLNEALERVDGTGFHETPLRWSEEMKAYYKNETGSVGQSHKARHLMGIMLYLHVLCEISEEWATDLRKRRLAVASCGNAGLAAATIAAAADWPIDVYIPTDAGAAVESRLKELNATVHICTSEPATVVSFKAAVEAGSIPFSVQGPYNGLVVEGSSTIVFEIIGALQRDFGETRVGSVYAQVGGGAFGSGMVHGFRQAVAAGTLSKMPMFNTVQTHGGHPLERAHSKVVKDLLQGDRNPSQRRRVDAIMQAKASKATYMQAWEAPHSVAHGILDDETYDWMNLCDAMLQTGGEALVVSDERVCQATDVARHLTGVNMCHTGASGLAGYLEQRDQHHGGLIGDGPAVVVFTGKNRDGVEAWPSEFVPVPVPLPKTLEFLETFEEAEDLANITPPTVLRIHELPVPPLNKSSKRKRELPRTATRQARSEIKTMPFEGKQKRASAT